jgi:hypothetical protein
MASPICSISGSIVDNDPEEIMTGTCSPIWNGLARVEDLQANKANKNDRYWIFMIPQKLGNKFEFSKKVVFKCVGLWDTETNN